MFSGARQAYDSGSRATASGRDLESAALVRAARMLEDCHRGWDAPELAERLTQALKHNQRLWTFFQGEISAPDCPLPRELRVNVLQLSRFVDLRTFELLSAPDRDQLRVLIDINRQIAAGLSSPAPTAPVATPAS